MNVPAPARILASLVLLTTCAPSQALAAPVPAALDRPALIVRNPARVVLLAGTLAGTRLVAVGERGVVALSDDQGKRWRQSPTPVSVTLTAVRFASPTVGVAVGHGGVVLITGNGGETWSRVLDGTLIARLALTAATSRSDASRVSEANALVKEGADKPLLDVEILGDKRWIAVGAFGLAVETEDGGGTWSSVLDRLDNPKGSHLYAVRRRGSMVLIVGERGLALVSSDSGTSFTRLALPYSGSLFTAELPASGEIIVGGLESNVWRSADMGVTWSRVDAAARGTIAGSTTSPDGTVHLLTQSGSIVALRAGRAEVVSRSVPAPSNSLIAQPNGFVLFTGQGAVAVDLSGASK